ncbi:sugar phosphate isomerase/epimerase [bacterium]|nr:sugar phosphate isomerase/epimerase [Akkermansiaceae bacterium]MDB4429732.1 sugar phosphate isomerase/epimerase [Akkermansiaceae bacterium]MDB4525426.1 sugar phosphate isomerase/epimerase [Akkermansiaceae bacterium]MDB4588051.1 sugar phosphate isomerase/epimerase [bacterium]
MNSSINRRHFITGASAALGSAVLTSSAAEDSKKAQSYEYCTFIKFIQDLSHEELAVELKKMGFDGAEVTVRKGGYIAPEAAAEELPKLDEVFKKHDLKINILTTDIAGPDSPNVETILATASKLGIQRYRMGFCRYDLKAPIKPQIEELKSQFKELAAMNREAGVTAVYQNHAGAKYMGATFWDLEQILRDIPKEEIGSIFDIRHAVADGGTAWPIYYDIIKPHISALSIKDFNWGFKKKTDTRLSPLHGPLGEGQVDLKGFLKTFKKDFESALVTLHIEYLGKEGVAENLAAIDRDFKVLRKAMD